MAKKKTTPALPERFRPFLDQAQTEADLRYGGQEAMFGTVLGQLSRDRDRQLGAQQTAHQSLLGSLQGADANVDRYYSDAGLTPSVLGTLAQDATGRRLASEMAGYRAQNQQGLLGQLAGNQYANQRINQDYGDKSQTVFDQAASEQRERGTFTSSLLNQLIQGDRSARSAANAAARTQANENLQNSLDRGTSTTNAALGQGYALGEDGTLTPIPGGKADPNNPKNKPKRTTGPGTASPDSQRDAGTDFSRAVSLAKGMINGRPITPDLRQTITNNLATGRDKSGGEAIYETVPVLNSNGVPKEDEKGRPITKQVRAVWKKGDRDQAGNPIPPSLIGTQKTTLTRPAVPSFDAPIAAAAAEQAMFGYVTTATVRDLQQLGFSVNQIPGLKTENQYRASRPASPTKQRGRPKSTGSIRDIYG